MPFMVIYRTSDGSSCFEQADAIDEAALFVERLRNQEGIDPIQIYRMEEITFAFRPYYKVELGLAERQDVPPPPPPPPPPQPVSATPVEEPVAEVEVEADDPTAPEAERPPAETAPAVAEVGTPATDAVAEVHTESGLPSRPRAEGEPAGANGRRGLFGR